MFMNTNANIRAVFSGKDGNVHSRVVTAFDDSGVAYVTRNDAVKDMTGKADLVRVDHFRNFRGLVCHSDGDLDVIGTAPATGWRYARDVKLESGTVKTYPVDAFLVRANGDLTPVAYDGEKMETIWLELEGDTVVLRTELDEVPWEDHFADDELS